MEEQESNRPYHWKDDDSMLEKRDGLEIIGEVKDTYTDVVSGPSDEPSNDESEEDNEENGVEAGSEENDLQVPINGLPLSADGTGKTHSIATSLDGALLKCAQCKEEQEVRVIESVTYAILAEPSNSGLEPIGLSDWCLPLVLLPRND